MKTSTLVLTGVLALALVSLPFTLAAQEAAQTQTAQEPQGMTEEMPMTQPGQASTQTFTGTVVSWDGSNLVVKGDAGGQMTFTADAQTQLPSSMSTGSPIKVQYRSLEGGKYLATSVSAGTPSAKTETARSTETETATESSEELPATASPLALLALTGVLTLGVALVLRSAMRRQG